jgi:hypothetical protein
MSESTTGGRGRKSPKRFLRFSTTRRPKAAPGGRWRSGGEGGGVREGVGEVDASGLRGGGVGPFGGVVVADAELFRKGVGDGFVEAVGEVAILAQGVDGGALDDAEDGGAECDDVGACGVLGVRSGR